jgi:hypothetical protein
MLGNYDAGEALKVVHAVGTIVRQTIAGRCPALHFFYAFSFNL